MNTAQESQLQPADTSTSAPPELQSQHPRLRRLRDKAKVDASNDHDRADAEKRKRKQRLDHHNKPKKVVTKRQISNKRSAEICREAQSRYITYLENEIQHEEQEQRSLLLHQFHVSEQLHLLTHSIRELEKRRDAMSGSLSWIDDHMEQSSNVQQEDEAHADFFQTSDLERVSFEQQDMQSCVTTIDCSVHDAYESSEPFPQSLYAYECSLFQDLPVPFDLNFMCNNGNATDALGFHLKNQPTEIQKQEFSPVTVIDTAADVPDFAFKVPTPRADMRIA